jgi:CBS domain-containing protein
MADTVQDVMNSDVIAVDAGVSIEQAARVMRQQGIGDVLVTEGDRVRGILTDRDIVVRAVAENKHPTATFAGDCCSRDVKVVDVGESVDRAIELMRDHALRRLPAVQDDRLVGIVSLGDLAVSEDRRSALADISAAEPNV